MLNTSSLKVSTCGVRLKSASTGIAVVLAALAAAPAAAAPGLPVVSACTGASLPPSRLTPLLTTLTTDIFTPLSAIPLIGPGILAGVGGIVADAVSGGPIGLDVQTINPLTGLANGILTPGSQCTQQANGFQLATDKGITIGGNSIDGLGSTGLNANAGEVGSIALGNSAATDAAATNSIALGTSASATAGALGGVAIGNGATVTTAGGVALGQGSVDRAAVPTGGATIGGTAYTFAGATPTSVVSVGTAGAERQIVNVAAGQLSAASTDAVNGSQLFATNTAVTTNATNIATNTTNITANTTAITNLNSGTAGTVQRDPVVPDRVVVTAAGGTGAAPGTPQTVSNVANGTIAAGSTDAVNGDQLNTTNGNVATNTTNITNLSNGIGGGTLGLVQQVGGAPGAGTITVGAATSGTLVDLTGLTGPRTLTGLLPGALSPTSTDAVNGSQLDATNTTVAGNTTAITNLNNGTAGPVQQTGAPNGLALVAPGGTGAVPGAAQTLSNVAPGVAATDAVDVGQVNGLIGASAAAAPIQYSNAAAPTTPTPGIVSNDVTLVGLAPGVPVTVHNVAPGLIAPGSTDAVNGDQLNTTNANVATNTTNIAGNTTAITNLSAGVNNGTLGLVQQTGGAPGTGPITVGAVTGGTVVDFTANAGTAGAATRTLSGVTAGVAPTDAVNVSQLTGTVGAATANAVQYDTVGGVRANSVTLAGGAAGPVTVTNVAAGALTPASTDAVNGSQLAATNATVTTNTANIAGNTTAIVNLNTGAAGTVQRTATANNLTLVAPGGTGAAPGAAQTLSNVAPAVAATDAVDLGQVNGLIATSAGAGPIQYSDPAAPTTPTPGVVSNSTTLVGTVPGTAVALHNVAAGALTPTSTDAVNGSQLTATNAQTTTNTTNIAGNTTAITNLNNGTAGLVQQTGGAPGNGQITVGAATGGTSVTIAGTGGNRTLTGLNAGVAGNDAVTVAQINGLTGNGLNNVQYDPSANGGRSNTITLAGGAAGTVRITNVGGGTVAPGSTDAVNGGQLAATNATVTNLTNGQAGAFQSNNAAGAAAPVATGANASAGGFGASATGVGGLALGNGAISTGAGSVALGQGSTDGGASRVVSVGSVGGERRITNVAPGINGTDAVNLSQLQAVTTSFGTTTAGLQNQVTGLQGQISQTNFNLNQVRRRANGATAGAMAVAGLPQAFEPGKSLIGGAVGYWDDQVAFAIGVSSIVGEHTVLKAGGSISNQGVGGFNAGIGYQF